LLPVALLALMGPIFSARASGVTLFTTIQIQSGAVANQNTTFFGNVSNLPAGCQVITWTWNFGDGQTGTGQTVSHIYTANTTYTVTLQVFDSCSDAGSTSQQVTIGGGVTGTGCTPGTYQTTFTLTATPNPASVNQSVTFFASSQGAAVYSWNFGDGQTTTTTN